VRSSSSRTTSSPSPVRPLPPAPDLRTVHFTHTPSPIPAPCGCCRPTPPPNSSMAWRASGVRLPHAPMEAEFRACYSDPAWRLASKPPQLRRPARARPGQHAAEAATDAVSRAGVELERSLGGRQLMLRVDRVELSKNILRGSGPTTSCSRRTRSGTTRSSTSCWPTVARRGRRVPRLPPGDRAGAAEINEHWGHPGGSRSCSTWPTTATARWRRWRATTSWSATRCATDEPGRQGRRPRQHA